MIGALWILLVTVVAGAVFYLHYRLTGGDSEAESATDDAASAEEESTECCGQHLVCEKDTLVLASDKVVYYDDEELDAYRGRSADDFTEAEIEQFRDVLYTLQPGDLTGWARSIQLREVTLPTTIHDELLMLLAEVRNPQA